ncbi:hypothetical protein A7985_20870 [Pseudoalteromonas luteoviolacea]|uniref:Cupin domain-containing protein n=1 Tax=Pseudoalteromonas luteoviolacea TaxID=43657 RepID=A0A1C0TL26_9GAMM|nr:cupin domain-containing protein [Pseudoalteromonas luteoviolacea]OCQ19189.1 hypothetical protein A7985_20870 [Pseudoalteromonas luteoviolacea]
MEMKEFYYENGIRVSLFNLDHRAVPYHFHQSVSDMIYCAKGAINIELPDKHQIYHVPLGEVFQIPSKLKHRFANAMEPGMPSRYVLMQLGEFDIEFVKNNKKMDALLEGATHFDYQQTDVYIENRKQDILALVEQFAANKPEVLDEEELNDVLTALKLFATQGVEARFPENTLESA